MTPITVTYGNYSITTDRSLLQPTAIHEWLSQESYWAKDVPYNVVKTSFDHSFVVGVLLDGAQVGYARIVTDYATFGYLADVYVLAAHRGLGLSKQMMQLIMGLDWVKNLRRLMLASLDAQGLYEQFGFTKPHLPERYMEITLATVYQQQAPPDTRPQKAS